MTDRAAAAARYAMAMQWAHDEHEPLFTEVRRLTGLEGHIWQSGGMTMTIVVPLACAPDGTDAYPAYLGLRDGVDAAGRWRGSLSFYAEEETDPEDAPLIVGDNAGWPPSWATPEQWAAALAEHYWATVSAIPHVDSRLRLATGMGLDDARLISPAMVGRHAARFIREGGGFDV